MYHLVTVLSFGNSVTTVENKDVKQRIITSTSNLLYLKILPMLLQKSTDTSSSSTSSTSSSSSTSDSDTDDSSTTTSTTSSDANGKMSESEVTHLIDRCIAGTFLVLYFSCVVSTFVF